MSELYSASETDEATVPASHEAGTPASADSSPSYAAAAQDSDFASYSDADIEAVLAAEEQLPESRTRQEAAADTWGDSDQGEDGTPDPDEQQVTVRTKDGTEAQVTVQHLPPEARTVGDTTPTGIGRKPTGEEILAAGRDNPRESPVGRLFDEAVKEADDLFDGSGHLGEAIENDASPRPGPSGHSRSYHATTGTTPDHPAAPDSGPSDSIGSMVIIGVAAAIGLRRALSALRKEHEP
jgi:hypothetical protein